MEVSIKLRPGKLRPQISDHMPQNSSLPPTTPRVARPSEVESHGASEVKGLRIRLVQPVRSTGEFLVISRRLGHRGAKSSVSSLALNCNLLDIDQVGNFKVVRKNLSDQSHPPYFQKRGAESSFPGFFPTRRLRTVVFLRFKNDRSSYTVKFRK